MDERLPDALRVSNLPWAPDLEHQSPAPAPDDSWHALVGTLEWSILVHRDGLHGPGTFLLSLRDTSNLENDPYLYQDHPVLRDAAIAAEAMHELLLEQLRVAVSRPA